MERNNRNADVYPLDMAIGIRIQQNLRNKR